MARWSPYHGPRDNLYGGYERSPKVRSLRAMRRAMDVPETPSVLYPGSSWDVSVATVFGKENVQHVDPHREAMLDLRDCGYKAAIGSIEHFESEPVDVIVALRAGLLMRKELTERLLADGGYTITDAGYTLHDFLAEEGQLIGVVHTDRRVHRLVTGLRALKIQASVLEDRFSFGGKQLFLHRL